MSRLQRKLTDKDFYLRQILAKANECRTSRYEGPSERALQYAFGMIAAGLFLLILTEDEYNRLWELATNAAVVREHELVNDLLLYTYKPQPVTAMEAAA